MIVDQAHKDPTSPPSSTSIADSPTYGKVLRTVSLPERNAVGKEPHHVGLARDGRTPALGGLSVLRRQDQVFFFDVSDRRNPRRALRDRASGG